MPIVPPILSQELIFEINKHCQRNERPEYIQDKARDILYITKFTSEYVSLTNIHNKDDTVVVHKTLKGKLQLMG